MAKPLHQQKWESIEDLKGEKLGGWRGRLLTTNLDRERGGTAHYDDRDNHDRAAAAHYDDRDDDGVQAPAHEGWCSYQKTL